MKNITEENNQIPEMYILRHKHDTYLPEMGYDYSNNLLNKTLSAVLFNNEKTSFFLEKYNDMVLSLIESILPVRNLFFYTHNKYYNKHGK
mgnify:CR=1 FL=1